MTADSGEPMRRARRLDSLNKAALVLAAADAALIRAGRITISGVARDAGVGRKFIYDHPDLKTQIELKAIQATTRHANDMTSAARVTAASLRAELANTRAQNHRLNCQLRAAENRLSQAEGVRIVADDLLPDAVIASLADQQLAQRNIELEQQLFEAQEALLRTAEELEAARTINRELMQHANQPARDTGPPVPCSAPATNSKRRRPVE